MTFEAENAADGYRFGYHWYMFDALETSDLIINGTNDTDIISAGSGRDFLRGFGDADWIDGGPRADRMFGGTGKATYVVNAAGDWALEESDAGTDTVRARQEPQPGEPALGQSQMGGVGDRGLRAREHAPVCNHEKGLGEIDPAEAVRRREPLAPGDQAPTKRRAAWRSCRRINATAPLHSTQLVSKT